MSDDVNPNPFAKSEQPTSKQSDQPQAAAPNSTATSQSQASSTGSSNVADNSANPFNSGAPTATSAPAFQPSNQSKPKKSGSKGLIIGIVVGVVALILIVAAIVIFVMMGKVTADDYDEAIDALADVNRVTSDVSSEIDINDIEDGDADALNDAIDEVDKTIKDGQTKIDDLGKLKAITNDDESKKLFDDLNSKYGAFGDSAKQILNRVKSVMPVLTAMTNVDDISYSDYAAMATGYQNIADAAKKADADGDLRSALDDLAESCQEYATYYQQRAAGQYPDQRPSYSKLSNATDKLQESFSYDDLMDKASEVSDAYNDLSEHLYDQYWELSD